MAVVAKGFNSFLIATAWPLTRSYAELVFSVSLHPFRGRQRGKRGNGVNKEDVPNKAKGTQAHRSYVNIPRQTVNFLS